jgi:hypothetical protein
MMVGSYKTLYLDSSYTIQYRDIQSNSEGNFFLSSDRFIGRNPPTIEDLQRQVMQKNCRYIEYVEILCSKYKRE